MSALRCTAKLLKRLKVDVDLRNIHANEQHWDDLVAARGRGTVPVLRITAPDGDERWMPESGDIVRYLKTTYSSAA